MSLILSEILIQFTDSKSNSFFDIVPIVWSRELCFSLRILKYSMFRLVHENCSKRNNVPLSILLLCIVGFACSVDSHFGQPSHGLPAHRSRASEVRTLFL
jgi:hypothetical protein